uniref:CN hydrolase domain-containing protein n=1 Tax=Vannella robusta TaxID=1487602 RepID=A0A7S4HYP6_9EUKA|mmetsp:Transcript_17757/g.22572  ORF Transcript_17757/g.22572 Transcript_17757/m.22572 type:complete len:298 (+) Transcript_17757:48-941(+)
MLHLLRSLPVRTGHRFMSSFTFAGCQIPVTDDKFVNHSTAEKFVRQAVEEHKAQVVCLPECWNCPYANSAFPKFAEDLSNMTESSASASLLSRLAKELKIYLIGGSIPEKDGDKLYNTSLSFGPSGELIGKFRKVHLFDVDVPGKITFIESDTLSAGNSFTVIETEYANFGVGICFDVRFPEFTRYYQEKGCNVMVFPGAFNMTTGPAHWELLLRSRAVDYQMFVCGVSPARDENSSYTAWGHSSIINPWGEVISTTEHQPAIITAKIDLEEVHSIRKQIPVIQQRRISSDLALSDA